jgi:phage portal protein BeeE
MKFEDSKFTFTQNGNDRGTWVNIPAANQYEMIYFKEFNISDDTKPGPGAAQVALMSAGLLRYTSDFASKFFEQGAMPVGLLSIEQNITAEERARAENFFRRMAQGISNAWRILAIRGPAKIDYLTPPIKDMTMPELRAEARHDIALAFGIPQTLLENSANFATAVQHDATFWETTIRPRGNWIAQTFNEQLFNLVKINDKRLHADFAFDEMDVFQEDESVRAGSLLNLVAAGFDLITAADVLGYDLTDDQLARLESLNNTEPAQTQADVQKAKWMRKALKSLEKGKGASVSFESEDIPSDEHARIAGLLSIAKTPAEVRSAFTRRDSQGAIDRLNETLREAMDKLK